MPKPISADLGWLLVALIVTCVILERVECLKCCVLEVIRSLLGGWKMAPRNDDRTPDATSAAGKGNYIRIYLSNIP
jgi:hypothetical protein